MPTNKIKNYLKYSIDIKGNVRNDDTKHMMSHNLNSTGYKRVNIYNDKARKYKQCLLHRLLAVAFVPNPYNVDTVDHIDGNRLNNSIENLQWVTKQENTQRAYDKGLNSNKKLTTANINAIKRDMAIAVRGTQARLASKYKVHTSRIRQVCNK